MRHLHWLFVFTAALMVACGGAGNQASGALSGTAASGLPIANATVSVKDRFGNIVTETTSSDGNYSADLTGMSPPYLIQVGNLYSIATESGTANVHPFTDMIIRNWFKVQGLDVESVFAAPGVMPSPPTAVELATIESVVREILAPYMSGASVDPATFNLITTPFNADHTGFDLVLDNLTVTQPVTPGGDITIGVGGSTDVVLTLPETTSLTAAPTMTGFNPASGAVGTTVIIVGTNFSATPSDNIVTFGGGINATVISATTDTLTVTVPNGAKIGAITITTSGGASTSSDIFTVSDGAWSVGGNMLVGRATHTATLMNSGLVLVAGGEDPSRAATLSAEVYDPAANTWVATGSMATARYMHTATLLPDGKVMVAGGWDGFNPIDTVEQYDPVTKTWSAAASMAHARFNHTATLLPNGKVLVVGGANSGGAGALSEAEIYDPATNTWSAAGNIAAARQHHTATLLSNGKVLVTGGNNGGLPFASTELYDPVTNTWSAAASLATARGWHAATLLENGKVLVTGGTDNVNFYLSYLTSVELYDPATNIWTERTAMTVGRASHTATLLPNGKLMITAGSGDSGGAVELYDSATNIWVVVANMATARTLHTATLLPNGDVLLAGGADLSGDPAALTSAELTWPW